MKAHNIELTPCHLCNGESELSVIENKVEIKCKKCDNKVINKGKQFTLDQLVQLSIHNWNNQNNLKGNSFEKIPTEPTVFYYLDQEGNRHGPLLSSSKLIYKGKKDDN